MFNFQQYRRKWQNRKNKFFRSLQTNILRVVAAATKKSRDNAIKTMIKLSFDENIIYFINFA